MNSPLAEYLSALEARDAREQAHAAYINAYTKLADRTAGSRAEALAPPPAPSLSTSTKSLRPGTPKDKGSPAPQDVTSPSSTAQLRAELASTQRIRAALETKLSTISAELDAFKASDAAQKRRISQLEKTREQLDRKVKDRAEELKGKGRLVEGVQDEMVAINLQLHMMEQERDKLRMDNEELTRRWVEKMEQEAQKMNDENISKGYYQDGPR
ncbi:autophagy protein 16 [Lindgomyces ingoldianus]|uniref:Autophagy protein 16 n=1 Tax=Lindgomyces ingoldianus TaxID=673940 RepID=A0ACB6R8K2_9PLEO|nr:autophagy protein 16 [Lindgomyces ingoldianus]KAF2475075.1 autophagy protein 16 [Lindgomyces ingoldianus]